MQLEENTLFANRYQLIRLLGRGGFSEVWLAEDSLTTLRVALKVYAPGAGMDENGVKIFSSEFSLVFNLNHSNLLKPTYYDTFERMPYLVMPYCESGSSAGLVGKINEDEAWNFLHDIAAGLEYLHAQEPPVIHQDIKPDNVLIDASGRFLLTDFGISIKARNTLRKSMMKIEGSVGTLAYMGPERFSKFPLPIKASDIFSLGVTLFELLTGTVPFGEHGGLLLQHGAEIPVIEGNWSDSLKSLIEICLHKDTWERPTAEEVRLYTEQYLRGEKPVLPARYTNVSNPVPEEETEQPVPEVAATESQSEKEAVPSPEKAVTQELPSTAEIVSSLKIVLSQKLSGSKKQLFRWGIPTVIIVCLVIAGINIQRLKMQKEAEDRALEIENRYSEYLSYIHQGDSLVDRGNQSQGGNYEGFYLEAIRKFDQAGQMEEQYQTEFQDIKDALSKKETVLQKIDEIYLLFTSTAGEAEQNEDFEMAEIFFKRAAGLKNTNILNEFHQRREAAKESGTTK